MATNPANQSRRDMIDNALSSYKERGERKALSIDYRGIDIPLEVIRINPKYLLLNHDNSRLAAQLFDHPQRHVVEKDPTSAVAQDLLADLLRRTVSFSKLKEELRELSQQNAGLISRDGLLINGNTRVVALRDLGCDGVDVAVLPADAMVRDFLDLEMSLQMRQLTQQDYTFTNELLLIEKYRKYGHNEEELARKMGWIRGKKKKVAEATQLLQLINEIRNLVSPPIAYKEFDAKAQHLRDLNEVYINVSHTDITKANDIKWGRIVAMFLGVNKDQTRAIDYDFFQNEVMKRIKKESNALVFLGGFKRVRIDDDLDDLLGADDTPDEKLDLRSFTEAVVGTLMDIDGSLKCDFTDDLQEIHNAIRLGAEATITEGKRKSLLLEPATVLQESRISLEGIISLFNDISTLRDFDHRSFEFELNKVKSCIDDLTKELEALKRN